MFRQKWTWMAVAVVACISLTLQASGRMSRIEDRIRKLELYIPYLPPSDLGERVDRLERARSR